MNKLFFALAFFISISGNTQTNTTILKGEIRGPFVWKSNIYPGTQRNYWIYLPQQYKASSPACLMVVQDGVNRARGWKLPAVLDTLIARKEIPVMIGVFIEPGIVPASDTSRFPHFNRSFEYDALGDRYARFLLEEILPEVKKTYNISDDPNDRSIAGSSSGAICAFNVAWERPDAFRRVFSPIGTYVGLRGGHELATLIRKTEPKPLRIFLQDGSNDNNSYGGDWWMANQNMLSAFTWSGYEVNHAWGDGGHDARHTITILADALRWLWKDYPARIKTHADPRKKYIYPIVEGADWQEIPLPMRVWNLAVNKAGEVFFTSESSIYKLDQTIPMPFATVFGQVTAVSFHSDDRLYVAATGNNNIIAINQYGVKEEILKNVGTDNMIVSDKGIYFTEGFKRSIGFYSFNKKQLNYFSVPADPSCLALSAEQSFLNIGVSQDQFGYYSKIKEDGSLEHLQEYIHYHLPHGARAAGIRGMTVDTANVLYSSTDIGIQASDQLGRVNLIFSQPAPYASDVKFGGPHFNILYVVYNGRLFYRRLNTKGVLSFLPPVRPSRPRM